MNEIITNSPSLDNNSISSMVSNNSLTMNNSNFNTFNWQNLFKYSVVIIILAFLGFNLFSHLGNLIDNINYFFSPITNLFQEKTNKVFETSSLNAAKGVKGIGNVTGNFINAGVNTLKHELDGKKNDTTQISDPLLVEEDPEPDTTDSIIQTTPKTGTGYCYVGEDRGIRSCVKINKNHKCMSGDIFPTRDLCINPNLRH
tara:strand:+ start:1564 stop:2163 length:600 start_codon:yes stop_codon:yes gene_type:complete